MGDEEQRRRNDTNAAWVLRWTTSRWASHVLTNLKCVEKKSRYQSLGLGFSYRYMAESENVRPMQDDALPGSWARIVFFCSNRGPTQQTNHELNTVSQCLHGSNAGFWWMQVQRLTVKPVSKHWRSAKKRLLVLDLRGTLVSDQPPANGWQNPRNQSTQVNWRVDCVHRSMPACLFSGIVALH